MVELTRTGCERRFNDVSTISMNKGSENGRVDVVVLINACEDLDIEQ